MQWLTMRVAQFLTPEGSQRLAGGRAQRRPPVDAAKEGSTPKGSQSATHCDPSGVGQLGAPCPGGRAGARPPANVCDPCGVQDRIARRTLHAMVALLIGGVFF